MTLLDVHVVTPEEEVWAGDADFLIARSVGGEIGILPGHEPVLAVLAPGPLIIRKQGGDVSAVVDGGFLSVAEAHGRTRVDVLAEHFQSSENISEPDG